LALAEAGAYIAVVSRKEDQDIESAVLSRGRRYLHHSADLTQRKETRKVITAVMEAMGTVDILVNNAGIIGRSPAEDYLLMCNKNPNKIQF
jgi:2-deoxy-D-gluconate 3-dehydrogenase